MKEPFISAVFALEDIYEIFVFTEEAGMISVKVGDHLRHDNVCGVIRSNSVLHCIKVPMNELDESKCYTVIYRKMLDRIPEFPKSELPIEKTFSFRPIPKENIRILHISDVHGFDDLAVLAAKKCGNTDLLILNGDISSSVQNYNEAFSVYRLAYDITGGEYPIVFSRGNHDLRGLYAEEFSQTVPSVNGCSYYTFRLGSLWGLVLDCGEDKPDCHEEYADTVCFHEFRLEETEFLNRVLTNAKQEYDEDGVTHRLVICHIPFTARYKEPFNIEEDIYKHWSEVVCQEIKPELLIFGHTHKAGIFVPQGELDGYGVQNCNALVGSAPDFKEKSYICSSIMLSQSQPETKFIQTKRG